MTYVSQRKYRVQMTCAICTTVCITVAIVCATWAWVAYNNM